MLKAIIALAIEGPDRPARRLVLFKQSSFQEVTGRAPNLIANGIHIRQ